MLFALFNPHFHIPVVVLSHQATCGWNSFDKTPRQPEAPSARSYQGHHRALAQRWPSGVGWCSGLSPGMLLAQPKRCSRQNEPKARDLHQVGVSWNGGSLILDGLSWKMPWKFGWFGGTPISGNLLAYFTTEQKGLLQALNSNTAPA